jgi:hypothetical protein
VASSRSGSTIYADRRLERSRASAKLGVVVTTISKGEFLHHYARCIQQYGRPEEVTLYIVADVNTPQECADSAQIVGAKGVRIEYLDIAKQEQFLAPFSALAARIPFRSDNRRNVGYLMALRDRCDIIVSVDDDNLPLDGKVFFEEHGVVGTRQRLPQARSANGWFNLGVLLETTDFSGRSTVVYPRGFPFQKRVSDASAMPHAGTPLAEGIVGVNVGLWLGEPDVDAVTRLATRCKTSAVMGGPLFLGVGQRSPINSQNTAIAFHAVPAYYFALQGRPIHGIRMDRFGDIFSGYFVQLCAEAVGHRVRVGPPTVQQDRNEHNLFKDLALELPGIVMLEAMVPLIEEALPRCASYADAYRLLAERIDDWSSRSHGFMWDQNATAYFRDLTSTMRLWVDACIALVGREEEFYVSPVA